VQDYRCVDQKSSSLAHLPPTSPTSSASERSSKAVGEIQTVTSQCDTETAGSTSLAVTHVLSSSPGADESSLEVANNTHSAAVAESSSVQDASGLARPVSPECEGVENTQDSAAKYGSDS